MPLPDASKKSPRVYTLLQNTDLDNVTFANVQAVGNPIAIEEANEDEMRRLVLVNLCRLVTSGEWTGLLDAGGGGGDAYLGPSPNGDWQSGRLDYQSITCSHGRTSQAQTTLDVGTGRQMFWPFTAANTGDLTQIGLAVSTTATGENVRVGIYNAADDGNPSDLIGYADFDGGSLGAQYVTSGSFSDTITLERGTLYWYAVVQTTEGDAVHLTAMNCTYSGASYLTDAVAPTNWTLLNYTTTNALSDPAATDEMRGGGASYAPAHVSIRWL
jgi:hypothetical protein